tara:strand:- start:584 stop:1540 length:957 start_codon:yes stop_codon:yes gene_type:complete
MIKYGWHETIWQRLFTNKDSMAHAYIFFGKEAEANDHFSSNFCKALLCSTNNSGKSCSDCSACLWMDNQSHPDFFSVDTEGNEASNKLIPVASIRALKRFFELSPHQVGGKKIALILQSHRMNKAAANSLLKILEEPPNDCMIILSTDRLDLLLPTIKSRCQQIKLPQPSNEQSKEYLNKNKLSLDDGAIDYFNSSAITAIEQADNYQKVKDIIYVLEKGRDFKTIHIKADWLDYGLSWTINVIQKWCYDLFSYKLTNELFYFPNKKDTFEKLSNNISLSKMLVLMKKLNEVKAYASKPVNKEINLELVMIEYQKVFN